MLWQMKQQAEKIMRKEIKIGTRASLLAITQSTMIKELIENQPSRIRMAYQLDINEFRDVRSVQQRVVYAEVVV